MVILLQNQILTMLRLDWVNLKSVNKFLLSSIIANCAYESIEPYQPKFTF